MQYNDELKSIVMKKYIEIARLKKAYIVKRDLLTIVKSPFENVFYHIFQISFLLIPTLSSAFH